VKREETTVDSLATLQRVLESDARVFFSSALTFIEQNPLAASSSYTNVSRRLTSSTSQRVFCNP